ncbi:MAG: cytochrome c3 family protein [Magnetococcus sp. WYHC-3]
MWLLLGFTFWLALGGLPGAGAAEPPSGATVAVGAAHAPAAVAPQRPRHSPDHPPVEPIAVNAQTPNEACLDCHAVPGFKVPITHADGRITYRNLTMDLENFRVSVHRERKCVECHQDIEAMPHKKGVKRRVDCESCHQKTLALRQAEASGNTEALERVAKNMGRYQHSTHALPNPKDPKRPRAYCADCHNAHAIFPPQSKGRAEFRLASPEICGKCHPKQKDHYELSHHGVQSLRYGNLKTAVCADCHTAHQIASVKENDTRVDITRSCGRCHEKQLETYTKTYHGQVNRLGYAHTAKCYDCHEFHDQQKINDPRSSVHPDNRLKTCRKCHKQATEGYLSFYPHGSIHDREKYPEMWYVARFMELLLVGVFSFFWLHSALWFWREYRHFGAFRRHHDHHSGTLVAMDAKGNLVKLDAAQAHASSGPLCGPDGQPCRTHISRFSRGWRVAHAILAVGVILLVLTGTPVLFPDSFWASTVISLVGGPQVAAILHRVGAAMFASMFFGHIAVMMYKLLWKERKTFRWFGPYSLLPRWQDLHDLIAMFRWFFGKGPQPTFDHWTYWEKFDYWAPFWGMFIIGVSGLMMWFPAPVAAYLPGWVFNVATIVHGEEAFLAAVFLFTVHYFNCHFRPAKFPQDLVMFTGAMPIEEFIEERGVEYERLKASGELEKYLVNAPSRRLTHYSWWFGLVLILVSMVLLVFVIDGFLESLF